MDAQRVPMDREAYVRRVRTGPCFICALAASGGEDAHEVVFDDGEQIAHVHWHIAPLPPGTPYEEQQFHALMAEHGVLALSPEQSTELAARIRSALRSPEVSGTM